MFPLEGLNVLDFSHAGDGPMCGYMLAEAGASIIKVEPLQGEPYRKGITVNAFLNANQYKRSLAVNLQSPQGKEIVLKLAAKADIILESFTPGKAAAMGIGYDDINSINPRIIYCSLSGFGQTGPYSSKPAYDPVIQALSGFMMTTGEEGRPPVRVGPGVIGLGTAMSAAYGILLAVIMREKTGSGQYVDAAFFDTAVFYMHAFITAYSTTGMPIPRMGSGNFTWVPYQCFEAADGYIFIAVTQERFWQRFCQSIGKPEWETDPRFATNENRLAHRADLIELLSPIFKNTAKNEMLSRLEAAGVPCAPVQEIPDVIKDPQVKARHMIYETEYPGAGKIKVVHLPIKLSGFKMKEGKRPPRLGEHNVEILQELGYTKENIDAFMQNGVILEGSK